MWLWLTLSDDDEMMPGERREERQCGVIFTLLLLGEERRVVSSHGLQAERLCFVEAGGCRLPEC